MNWFNNLKLNVKFNIILSCLLICLFILTGFLMFRDQQTLLQNVARENARGLARQIIETRNYMGDVLRDEPESNYNLIPQVVATGVAKRMTAGSPIYVRQVSLRYRNPDNRPDPYETVKLMEFTETEAEESQQMTEVDGQKVYRYMLEMVAEEPCLKCHGSYEEAPGFVQERFPPGHFSYNYEIGEVIGAISISIPVASLYQGFGKTLQRELLLRVSILLFVFVVMGLLIQRSIIRPIRHVSTTMSRVARTGDLSVRIPGKTSRDEIGQMIASFNGMMEELGRTNLQRNESEVRYRNLIESSQTAIITFLEDGKIVISNQQAEILLNIPRQDLMGKSIFNLLENADALKQKISKLCDADREEGGKEIIQDRIRSAGDRLTEVEITLILASETDQNQMFTILLKELT